MAEAQLRFVVQRHRATGDHYDLRFEADGVLLSWAVPKGPTLDPTKRRAAFHVGDHPLEYLHFEGVLPRGSYGAGDVIVWDTGYYRPHGTDDPRAAVEAGELHVDVFGKRLRGRLALVRRGPQGEREQWLLVHKRDEHAVEGWDPDDHPTSVLTGRTNEQVLEARDRVWLSGRPADVAEVVLKPSDAEVDGMLEELDGLGGRGTWHVHGRALEVTDLDKVLFPGRAGEDPVTKRELLRYAALVAPTVLPYLTGRALHLRRHPNGVDTKGFWHKQRPGQAPPWVDTWDDPDAGPGATSTYAVLDEPAAVVWAAQLDALEWHARTSRTDQPGHPTYALVDLDPGAQTSWADLLVLARLHRDAFEHLGVAAYPKVTGGRGLQVWVPIRRGPTFEDTRAWVERLSRTIGAVVPDLVSGTGERSPRGGRARLDHTQNAVSKTLVAPYSPRARPGAPVSMPITWAELEDPELRPDRWTVRSAPDRWRRLGDLFAPALDGTQQLPPIG